MAVDLQSQSLPAPVVRRPSNEALEHARDRLAAALFALVKARHAAQWDRGVAAESALAEASREVQRAEAWLSLLERPVPTRA